MPEWYTKLLNLSFTRLISITHIHMHKHTHTHTHTRARAHTHTDTPFISYNSHPWFIKSVTTHIIKNYINWLDDKAATDCSYSHKQKDLHDINLQTKSQYDITKLSEKITQYRYIWYNIFFSFITVIQIARSSTWSISNLYQIQLHGFYFSN